MERHSETLGNALQLFYGNILASTADGVQIGTLHPQYVSQLLFTHVFSLNAFFKSIVVVRFIVFSFYKVWHIEKPHRPFQGSEADRLFCCFAERGTGIRPCGSQSMKSSGCHWPLSPDNSVSFPFGTFPPVGRRFSPWRCSDDTWDSGGYFSEGISGDIYGLLARNISVPAVQDTNKNCKYKYKS